MISPGSRISALAAVVVVSSCAPPAGKTAAAATPPAANDAPHKPVRMNGRGQVSSISLTDCFSLQQSDKVLLFDARPFYFYALGRIPGAISMPKASCDAKIAKREPEIKAALAAGKTIVVYCTSITCPDARTVAIHLADFGYSSSTLTGGWDSWKESGLPTE